MLYAISHDLRAPLMAIGGFTDLLLEQPAGLDDTRLRYLQRIREGNLKLMRLLDGLLKLWRIGRAPINPRPLDLAALAATGLRKLQQSNPTHTVILDIPAALPACGDAVLLGTLLDVLLDNAWKFTSATANARVAIGKTNEGTFFVRDNGAGFDGKQQGRLFKPLQRLHTEKQFPGIGIGLAIAARIVHLHRGRIWAEGTPEQGATVFFVLEPQPNR